MKSPQHRFDESYIPEPMSGCWLWTLAVNTSGYGCFSVGGKTRSAHRVSYELHHGVIPKGEGAHGTCVLHKCDVPSCVNPDHLFLGSNADNVADRQSKGRTVMPAQVGEKNGYAKLTSADVLEIRRMLSKGMLQREIADIFGVVQQTISLIKNGKKWSHVV